MEPGLTSKQPNVVASAFIQAIRDNAVDIFLVAPTLPVTVCLRRKLGFRVVKLPVIYLGFMLMGLFGWLALGIGAAGSDAASTVEGLFFLIGSFVYAGIAVFWRINAWGMIRRGELWHTRSRGISFLSTVLPNVRETYVQRFIEPGICLVVGCLVCYLHLRFIGIWLILSSFGLMILEALIYDQQLNTMLDQYDGIVDAQVAADNADFFSGKSKQQTPSIDQAAGVAVVVAPELRALIEQRRAQKSAQGLPPTE